MISVCSRNPMNYYARIRYRLASLSVLFSVLYYCSLLIYFAQLRSSLSRHISSLDRLFICLPCHAFPAKEQLYENIHSWEFRTVLRGYYCKRINIDYGSLDTVIINIVGSHRQTLLYPMNPHLLQTSNNTP